MMAATAWRAWAGLLPAVVASVSCVPATEDKDPTTSNLLQEVQHAIDKYQWQMRAMIQPTPTDPNTGADLNGGRPVALPTAAAAG